MYISTEKWKLFVCRYSSVLSQFNWFICVFYAVDATLCLFVIVCVIQSANLNDEYYGLRTCKWFIHTSLLLLLSVSIQQAEESVLHTLNFVPTWKISTFDICGFRSCLIFIYHYLNIIIIIITISRNHFLLVTLISFSFTSYIH